MHAIGCAVLVCIVIGVIAIAAHQKKKQLSDRHRCWDNQRRICTYANAYRYLNDLAIGDPMDRSLIIKHLGGLYAPCPSGGTYTWLSVFPDPEKGQAPVTYSLEDRRLPRAMRP